MIAGSSFWHGRQKDISQVITIILQSNTILLLFSLSSNTNTHHLPSKYNHLILHHYKFSSSSKSERAFEQDRRSSQCRRADKLKTRSIREQEKGKMECNVYVILNSTASLTLILASDKKHVWCYLVRKGSLQWEMVTFKKSTR